MYDRYEGLFWLVPISEKEHACCLNISVKDKALGRQRNYYNSVIKTYLNLFKTRKAEF